MLGSWDTDIEMHVFCVRVHVCVCVTCLQTMTPLYLRRLMVFMGNHLGSSPLCVPFDLRGWPRRSEDDWLIIPLITANVLLSHCLAVQAGGGAVELKKTQTTIHQLMDSSYTAGWEGWV